MNILVTGGAGYIGSHCCLELLTEGHNIVVIDNLSNASQKSILRVEKITHTSIPFYKFDIRNKKDISKVFMKHSIDAVVHFAGLKAVGESVDKPMLYYDNNISGTITLLEVMELYNCKKIVFSSSATVYGDSNVSPIKENSVLMATNPYGHSKLFIESLLEDIFVSDNSWDIAILRYFNPVGAHKSGFIGEDPNGTANNLMPLISQVAVGKKEYLSVFGGDYETNDGTGIRDYIHVVDLVKGHIKALSFLNNMNGVLKVNLGTGIGYSVLEIIEAFRVVSGKDIPYKIVPRRLGDIATSYADTSFAKKVLGWQAELGLSDMCKDSWHFQTMNPNGYKK